MSANIRYLLLTTMTLSSVSCRPTDLGGLDRSAHLQASDQQLALSPELRTGIYWYGQQGARQKAAKGQTNPYYDPTKPTIIYTHGWQLGAVLAGRDAVSYTYADAVSGQSYDLAAKWLDDGWNVGAFLWDQFADEEYVGTAEGKIWGSNTVIPMRWKDQSGMYRTDGIPADTSVADLFYQSYIDALADYKGSNIRLVGHSLGSQLVVALTGKLRDGIARGSVDKKYLPKRNALLDPVWMRSYTSQGSGQRVYDIVRNSRDEVAYETLKTSGVLDIPFGDFLIDRNHELTGLIGEMVLSPDYANATDPLTTMANRHGAAISIYFLSKVGSLAEPSQMSSTCSPAPLAGASDAAVFKFMQQARSCRQNRPMSDAFDLSIPGTLFVDPYEIPVEIVAEKADSDRGGGGDAPDVGAPDDGRGSTGSSGNTSNDDQTTRRGAR